MQRFCILGCSKNALSPDFSKRASSCKAAPAPGAGSLVLGDGRSPRLASVKRVKRDLPWTKAKGIRVRKRGSSKLRRRLGRSVHTAAANLATCLYSVQFCRFASFGTSVLGGCCNSRCRKQGTIFGGVVGWLGHHTAVGSTVVSG